MKIRTMIIIGTISAFVIISLILLLTVFGYCDYSPFCENFVIQDNDPYKSSMEQLGMVLDYCNDTSEMKNAIGFEYFNDTHYINNNLCKWQKLTKFPNSDEYCIPGQNMWADVKEIRNYTHIYNKDKCMWEQEFSWTAQYGKSDPTVMILQGAVVENQSLDPKVISVVLGKNNTLVWVNGDDVPHGIASDNGGDHSWGTGTILPGESASVIFNQTGIFEYHGVPHPWITGKVIVLEK